MNHKELEQEALKLRLRGFDIFAIAARLQVSERRARQLVERGYDRLRQLEWQELERWRTLQLSRLETLLSAQFDLALDGDPDAFRRVMEIIQTENRMLGIHQPAEPQLAFFLSGPALDLAIERELQRLQEARHGSQNFPALPGSTEGSQILDQPALAELAGGPETIDAGQAATDE